MLYREIIAVCSQIHTNHINTLCGQNVQLYIKTQSVPRSKHSVSVIKTSQLMLDRELSAVCSEIHTKHINTLCGQNVQLYIKIQSVPRSKHTPSGYCGDHCNAESNLCPRHHLSSTLQLHNKCTLHCKSLHIALTGHVAAGCKGRALHNKDHLLHASRNVIAG
jgi:predicted thioesterase